MRLTRDEVAGEGRFSRFELISWWNQERLSQARVLVVGAGALGNEIIKNCALVGIGNLLVADMDRIENSNLSRSVLFREADNGRLKAEVACEQARAIYPDLRATPFCGDVVHELGLGAYFWADVVIGALDNREARVALNSGAFFAGKPWVDGAIEVLDGVARVFAPGGGPCYECTMSEVDWKVVESRRSCALLSRDEMLEGRVPTTPTTASIVAAVEVQEAIKLLHGLDAMSGSGFVYKGSAGESYSVSYPRKPGCYAHDGCEELVPLGRGTADVTLGELLGRARAELGPSAVLGLSRDLVRALSCPGCATEEERFVSLGRISERDARCQACGELRVPETLITLGLGEGLESRTFAELGVPLYDVVTARAGERSRSYLFDGDGAAILGDLAGPRS